MRGAGIGAKATFNTLKWIQFLDFGLIDRHGLHDVHDGDWLKSDWTGSDAATTTDAWRFWTIDMVEDKGRGDGLGDDTIIIWNAGTHHWSTQDDGLWLVFIDIAAREWDEVLKQGTDTDIHVGWVLDAFTGDGDTSVGDRTVVLDGKIDTEDGGDVEVHDAIFAWKMPAFDFDAGGGLDHGDFPTLWIVVADWADSDTAIWESIEILVIDGDDVLMLLLDADSDIMAVEGLLEVFHTLDEVSLFFHEDSLVSDDVRFTLDGVDQDSLDRLIGLELDIGWEGGSTQADHGTILQNSNHVFAGEFSDFLIASILDPISLGFLVIVFNLDEIGQLTISMVMLLQADKGTRAGSVDRLVEEGGVTHTDNLILVDVVAWFNKDFCLWTTGIARCEIEEVWDFRLDGCWHDSEKTFDVLDLTCFPNHSFLFPSFALRSGILVLVKIWNEERTEI